MVNVTVNVIPNAIYILHDILDPTERWQLEEAFGVRQLALHNRYKEIDTRVVVLIPRV